MRRSKSVYKYFSGTGKVFLNTSQASPAPEKYFHIYIHGVSEKTVQKLFLSELRQISTNCNNFWKVDEKWLKLYAMYTFSTSPHSRHRTTLLNTKVLYFTVSQ